MVASGGLDAQRVQAGQQRAGLVGLGRDPGHHALHGDLGPATLVQAVVVRARVDPGGEQLVQELVVRNQQLLPAPVEVVVVRTVRGAPGGALVVDDADVAAVADAQPLRADAQREVDVVEVHHEGLVEAADLAEDVAPQGHARARDALDVVARARGRHLGRLVVEQVEDADLAVGPGPEGAAAVLT